MSPSDSPDRPPTRRFARRSTSVLHAAAVQEALRRIRAADVHERAVQDRHRLEQPVREELRPAT